MVVKPCDLCRFAHNKRVSSQQNSRIVALQNRGSRDLRMREYYSPKVLTSRKMSQDTSTIATMLCCTNTSLPTGLPRYARYLSVAPLTCWRYSGFWEPWSLQRPLHHRSSLHRSPLHPRPRKPHPPADSPSGQKQEFFELWGQSQNYMALARPKSSPYLSSFSPLPDMHENSSMAELGCPEDGVAENKNSKDADRAIRKTSSI